MAPNKAKINFLFLLKRKIGFQKCLPSDPRLIPICLYVESLKEQSSLLLEKTIHVVFLRAMFSILFHVFRVKKCNKNAMININATDAT